MARPILAAAKCVLVSAFAISVFPLTLLAADFHAKPGDDLGELLKPMRPGDVLLLADGTYNDVSIDFVSRFGLTIAAEHVVPVTVKMENGQPVAHGGGVILSSKNRPFVFANGIDITLRGLTIDGCGNEIQRGAIQASSEWTIENCIVQHANTCGISFSGSEEHRVKKITFRRVVAQDNGYIGMGGSFGQTIRWTECASFRNNRGWPTNVFGDQGYQRDGKWYVHVQWEGGGGKFTCCDDVIVDRHWAEGNNGPGMWFDWNNTNFTVRNSKFLNQVYTEFDYDALGMQLEINIGPSHIQNCLFAGNVGAMNIAEDHGAIIEHNAFVDSVWTRNISEGGRLRNDGVRDLTIADNDFYGDAKIAFWRGMDEDYRDNANIFIGPNMMHLALPVKWRPTPTTMPTSGR